MKHRLLVWLLALLSPLAHACPDALRLGAIPERSQAAQLETLPPLARRLGEALGLPVQVVPASSYSGAIDAVVSGGVDLALLGPASYLEARRRDPGIEAFAALVLAEGHFTPAGSRYQSLLVVRADGDFHQPGDLRGRRVALSDPASTSGNLIPRLEFPAAVGEPLESFFAGQLYAGAHDRALDALLNGKVEAAFVSSTSADDYLRPGLIGPHSLRVLWRSQPIPHDPLVFSSRLCGELRQRVRDLLADQPQRFADVLQRWQATGLVPVGHDAYRALEQALQRSRR